MGERLIEELPEEIQNSIFKNVSKKPYSVYALWACWMDKPVKKSNTSTGSKFSNDAMRLSKEIWSNAKVYHPETLAEDPSKTYKWLEPAQKILDSNGKDKAKFVLDFVFGNEQKNIAPDSFWHDKVNSPAGLLRNFGKILDAANNRKRRAESLRLNKPTAKEQLLARSRPSPRKGKMR